jgi:hypothetical protein
MTAISELDKGSTLALEAMSPVLHVEGLRTPLGSVMVGRRLSVAPFVVFVAFHGCYEYML